MLKAALVEEVATGPVISSRREVMNLLQVQLGWMRKERLIAIYVDSELRLITIERIADGSFFNAPVDLTKIVHKGLDVGAFGILVVHNHTSGNPNPSSNDWRIINRLQRLCADLDMHLVDSLIVGGGEVRSMLDQELQERACLSDTPAPGDSTRR